MMRSRRTSRESAAAGSGYEDAIRSTTSTTASCPRSTTPRSTWAADCDTDWVMRSDARDDRMLVFSKRFWLKAGGEAKFLYPLRVVSPGEFIVPGVAAEAMYQPSVRARTTPARCRATAP